MYNTQTPSESNFLENANIDKLNIPTIVLHGKDDKIVPISGCRAISKLDNVKFVEEKEPERHFFLFVLDNAFKAASSSIR